MDYTDEMKFPLGEDGGYNWGAIVNGCLESLDAGHELTFTFGEAVSAGQAVALKQVDGKIYKANSLDNTLTPAIGFSPNSVSADAEGKVRHFGWIDVDTSFSYGAEVSWSPGEAVYCDSVAGRISKTATSWANRLGYAKDFTDSSYVTRVAIDPKEHTRKFAGLEISNDVYNIYLGSSVPSSLAINRPITLVGPDSDLTNMPGYALYNGSSIYPSWQCRAYSHANVGFYWNEYYDGGTKGSHTGWAWYLFGSDTLFRIGTHYYASAGGTYSDAFYIMDISGTNKTITFNGAGEDVDVIVEGDTDTDLIHTDAANDRIGFSTSTPAVGFDCAMASRFGDSATNYTDISATGDVTFAGSAGFYPVRISQSAQPTPDTGELVIHHDTDDGKVYLVYNDTDSGVVQVEMT